MSAPAATKPAPMANTSASALLTSPTVSQHSRHRHDADHDQHLPDSLPVDPVQPAPRPPVSHAQTHDYPNPIFGSGKASVTHATWKSPTRKGAPTFLTSHSMPKSTPSGHTTRNVIGLFD